MGKINFNKDNFKEFKDLYNNNVKDNKERFMFEGKTFLTLYAKYVIEYLNIRLK